MISQQVDLAGGLLILEGWGEKRLPGHGRGGRGSFFLENDTADIEAEASFPLRAPDAVLSSRNTLQP